MSRGRGPPSAPDPRGGEMWQPDPAWSRLGGGMGSSTEGVWLAAENGRDVVLKRLTAPRRGDPGELDNPRHFAYWRRAAEVDGSGLVAATPGLGPPARCGWRRTRRGRPWSRSTWPAPRPPACSSPGRWASSPPATCATPAGWPGTSCVTGSGAWSTRAAGTPWSAPPWRTSPTTSGEPGRPTWSGSRRCPR